MHYAHVYDLYQVRQISIGQEPALGNELYQARQIPTGHEL